MATTGPSPLNLQLPEVNDVVDLSVINANYGLINTYAGNTNTDLANKTSQISVLNTAVGAAGSVQNAVKATNVAGGAQSRIPIQSAVNTTTFVAAPAAVGQVLYSSATSPYAIWGYPSPYKIASGTIASGSWSSGTASVDLTSYGFTQTPVISLTPVAGSLSQITNVTLSATPSATGFTAAARNYNGTSFSNGTPVTHWIAIQLLP